MGAELEGTTLGSASSWALKLERNFSQSVFFVLRLLLVCILVQLDLQF